MKVIKERQAYSNPWFTVVEKFVEDEQEPYWAIDLGDYVTVLATTANGEIIMVRQFRPCIGVNTLELPSGHQEKGESPAETCARELFEETGYRSAQIRLLGSAYTDTGRHTNKLWCFRATEAVKETEDYPEKNELDVQLFDARRFTKLIKDGTLSHALDMAVVNLAIAHGTWSYQND